MAPSVGLRVLSSATDAASSQPRTVASLPGGGASETPRSAAARNWANNSERAVRASPGRAPFTRQFGADAIEQMSGGDCDLLARFVVTRRRGLCRRCLHGADLAPGLIATALRHQRLDAQQTLFERLLLCEAGRWQQREHAIGIGGATGGKPGARGAQAEFGAVAARGFGSQPLVDGGGRRVIAGARSSSARSTLGGPPRRGVDGQPASIAASAMTTNSANGLARAFLGVMRRIAFTSASHPGAVEKYSGSELGASCGDLDAHRQSWRPVAARAR